MTEVLFRGKRIDNQEWVYGFYFCMHHNDGRNHIHHFIIPLDAPLPKDKPIGEIQVDVAGTTVSQFTGVVDKNNDKIFCGDIIHTKYEYPSPFDDGEMCTMDSIKKVVYTAGGYDAINTYAEPTPMYFLPCDVTEIIGNIYDTPELFEVNK